MPASSWPVIAWIARMISSVTCRRALPSGTPSYRPTTSIGPPNSHRHRDDLGEAGADGLQLLRAGEADRYDARAGRQRQVGDPGATAVEPAVARAGALGVDAERLAAAEHLERGVEAGERGLRVVAIDREHPQTLEPQPTGRALETRAGEVVGLGEEGDLARRDDRDHQGVGEAEVVAGKDHRPGHRDVVEPDHRRPPDQLRDRGHHRVHDRVHLHPTQSRGYCPVCRFRVPECHGLVGVVLRARHLGNR